MMPSEARGDAPNATQLFTSFIPNCSGLRVAKTTRTT
ncbi:Uncharacterised protein [Mycobacterium tuberculosis]|nr:Uncharacterised protein [Mycobacterium tuberculosis]